jgi:hypothetical protein
MKAVSRTASRRRPQSPAPGIKQKSFQTASGHAPGAVFRCKLCGQRQSCHPPALQSGVLCLSGDFWRSSLLWLPARKALLSPSAGPFACPRASAGLWIAQRKGARKGAFNSEVLQGCIPRGSGRMPLAGIAVRQRALAQTDADRMPLRAFWSACRPLRATCGATRHSIVKDDRGSGRSRSAPDGAATC